MLKVRILNFNQNKTVQRLKGFYAWTTAFLGGDLLALGTRFPIETFDPVPAF